MFKFWVYLIHFLYIQHWHKNLSSAVNTPTATLQLEAKNLFLSCQFWIIWIGFLTCLMERCYLIAVRVTDSSNLQNDYQHLIRGVHGHPIKVSWRQIFDILTSRIVVTIIEERQSDLVTEQGNFWQQKHVTANQFVLSLLWLLEFHQGHLFKPIPSQEWKIGSLLMFTIRMPVQWGQYGTFVWYGKSLTWIPIAFS